MHSFFRFLLRWGAIGLLGLSVADSSFLFAPLGNDFLLIALTARHHDNAILYVLCAAAGSVIGVWLLDLVCRPEGEEGLERLMSSTQLKRVKQHVKKRAGLMVFLVTLAPPPFPFTAMVAAASALQYPRVKLLSVVGLGRLVRFSIVAYVAIVYGSSIIRFMELPEFKWTVAAFAVMCIVGSVFSILRWRRG